MPHANAAPPRYLHHKAKDRGFAYVYDDAGNRRQRYFPGAFNSPESRRAYLEFLELWERGDAAWRPAGATPEPLHSERLTVAELVDQFLRWADRHYVKNGEPTGEVENLEHALRPVLTLFADTAAEDFGPKRLRAVRDAMEDGGRLSRKVVNSRIRRIRRAFSWAVAEELVPPSTIHGLRALTPLQHGRSKAPDREPIEPVAVEVVLATVRHCTPTVRAAVLFALHTGARPGEVCDLRWRDVDRTDPRAWLYVPPNHKNLHRSQQRAIGIGPRAQAALEHLLDVPPDAFVFSPKRSEAERRILRRQARVTPLTPSQRARDQARADHPRRPLGDCFDPAALRKSIKAACRAANIEPVWTTLQLRHSFEALAEREFGLEVASRALGHATLGTTEHYRTRRAADVAREVAGRIG